METNSEKASRAAWRIARGALERGDWTHRRMPGRATELVDMANTCGTALADAGCMGDEFGPDGSFELEVAVGFIAKASVDEMVRSAPVAWYRDRVFDLVRTLDAEGLLSPDEKRRARVFGWDAEQKREEERRAENERREAERRKAAEMREKEARRRAIEKRLAEINGEEKEVTA